MFKKKCLALATIIALSLSLAACGGEDIAPPKGSSSAKPSSSAPAADNVNVGLCINEVVTSNRYCLTAPDNSTPDWVEFYNGSDKEINLHGYGFSDDNRDPYKFTFPSVTMPANSYLIVYCTGAKSDDKAMLQAGFRLSAQGETLLLSKPGDSTMQILEVGDMPTDVSYGRMENSKDYAYFALPSPGKPNTGVNGKTPEFKEAVIESSIVINEYVYKNKYSIMDKDGDRPEWVEIKNTGDTVVDISNYGLSDDISDTKKWVFPEMTLQPGEIRVIFLSGKDIKDVSELHASFKLGSEDKKLLISQELGKTIDIVDINHNMGNASCGRSGEKWLFFPEPTPGSENNTKGFDDIEKATEKYLPDLSINEVKANATARAKDDPDWIELANRGTDSFNLKGYGLSDDREDLFKFTFDEQFVAPGEFLVVYSKNGAEGSLKTNFGVSPSGETIYLTRPDGVVMDMMETGVTYPGMSTGSVEGESSRVFFTTPTKGAANSSDYKLAYSEKPTFSRVGGYAEAGESVEITAPGTIYYTTDGSKPSTSSSVYSSAIAIQSSTPIRAIAVEDGKLPSEVSTENFLVEQKHDIPVVCIAVNPDEFFGQTNGIYADGPGHTHKEENFPHTAANFWKDIEREISFEWFEADGTKGIEFPAGVKIFGQYSRALDQKSLTIKMRDAYGLESVTYPFFRDYDVTNFNSLLLRVSGQDCSSTKLRDAFFAQAVKDTMDLDYMEYRPCAVYINGKYWGLYNLREQLDENYVANHYGVDPEKVDLIKGNSDVKAGSNEDWKQLKDYVEKNNLSNAQAYEYVKSRVDVEEYADYIITETHFCNTDSGNVRFWRDYDNNKYRWMLYDLDWSLNSSTTYKWNYIEEYFNPKGHGIRSMFSTTLSCGLLNNAEWKNMFIERYAYHLKNTFNAERMSKLLDAMAEEIRSEIPRHVERWKNATSPLSASSTSSVEGWESAIKTLNQRLTERVSLSTEHLQKFFALSDARMQELGLK